MNDTENDKRLKRLKYRANHRGIKEMDIILGKFADEMLESLTQKELDDFEALLLENDRDLLVWFTKEAEFPIVQLEEIFDSVSKHMNADTHHA
ncbi:MAG: succinate dehydrogenase assembly factor 2 [Pseudomonadota bacterium]